MNSRQALFFDASHWDVYALACILWSLWFRRDPWPRAFSAHKIMAAVTRGRRPPFPADFEVAPPTAAPGGDLGGSAHRAATSAVASSPPSPSASGHGAAPSSSLGSSASFGGGLGAWGDLAAALPPPPALRALVDRMWSHAHSMRPEVLASAPHSCSSLSLGVAVARSPSTQLCSPRLSSQLRPPLAAARARACVDK